MAVVASFERRPRPPPLKSGTLTPSSTDPDALGGRPEAPIGLGLRAGVWRGGGEGGFLQEKRGGKFLKKYRMEFFRKIPS